MANYSDIKGFTVQTLSTDTIASQQAGGAWASGGSFEHSEKCGYVRNTGNTASFSFGGAPRR